MEYAGAEVDVGAEATALQRKAIGKDGLANANGGDEDHAIERDFVEKVDIL